MARAWSTKLNSVLNPNDVSSALWKRRDAILDDNPIGGGMATPISNGVIALQIEAFDGFSWFTQWDSDVYGIPHAIRITVTATGMESLEEKDAPLVTLRTIVPLDRYQSPDDKLVQIAEEEEAERLAVLGIEPRRRRTNGNLAQRYQAQAVQQVQALALLQVIANLEVEVLMTGTIIIIDPDGNEHEIPID